LYRVDSEIGQNDADGPLLSQGQYHTISAMQGGKFGCCRLAFRLARGCWFCDPNGMPMERTPVLHRVLIRGVNQLMFVSPSHVTVYEGGERSGARLIKFAMI
jgi:hypothetical protein